MELGRKGGIATAQNRTKQERSEAARRAVQARWDKQQKRLEGLVEKITADTKRLEKSMRAKPPKAADG